MFPGVLATSVLFTAMFSAISIVWDREFGFLREMLVAPVRRGSILVGKCFGGATVATLQGLLVLVLAPLVDIPYHPVMLVELTVVMFMLAFALTAFGLVIAARISNIQAVMGVMQVLLLPLAFLSGSLYPLTDLPTWMSILVRLNPITYAVHLSREIVFSNIDASPEASAALNPPLTWGGWEVPGALSACTDHRDRPRAARHRDPPVRARGVAGAGATPDVCSLVPDAPRLARHR